MKTNVKGLAMVCAASLALMALMMIPGLLVQPTVVNAQDGQPGRICSREIGVTGCFTCGVNPAGGNGCDGTTTPPAGWAVGWCNDTWQAQTCVEGTMDCGWWIKCSNNRRTGRKCSAWPICI